MNWKPMAAAAALLVGAAGAGAASAAIVLQDNFGTTGAEGNWPGDTIFQSVPQPIVNGMPSVDLVGPGFFDNLAFSGNSVDLDGSTGTGFSPAGELQSVASLATGNYTVSFELAGNLRNAPAETTTVNIGTSAASAVVFSPANTQGYTLETATFKDVSGQVSFTDSGPASQQGNLLDNVVVSSVPEPATWAVMLVGFGGLGVTMRSNRRKQAAATA